MVLEQIWRYHVHTKSTDPRIKPVHHLFYKMGQKKKSSKVPKSFILQIPRVHGKIMLSGNCRTHDFAVTRHPVITGKHDFMTFFMKLKNIYIFKKMIRTIFKKTRKTNNYNYKKNKKKIGEFLKIIIMAPSKIIYIVIDQTDCRDTLPTL